VCRCGAITDRYAAIPGQDNAWERYEHSFAQYTRFSSVVKTRALPAIRAEGRSMTGYLQPPRTSFGSDTQSDSPTIHDCALNLSFKPVARTYKRRRVLEDILEKRNAHRSSFTPTNLQALSVDRLRHDTASPNTRGRNKQWQIRTLLQRSFALTSTTCSTECGAMRTAVTASCLKRVGSGQLVVSSCRTHRIKALHTIISPSAFLTTLTDKGAPETRVYARASVPPA
jgi:hypothetical protein